MLKSISCRVLPVSVFLLNACTSLPPAFDMDSHASSSQAVVLMYRPNAMANVFLSPDVVIDGSQVFAIANNEYHAVYLDAGRHQLKLDLPERFQGRSDMTLGTVAGARYFLRVSTAVRFQMNRPYDRWFDLEQVTEQQALGEIAQCKPHRPDKSEEAASAPVTDEEAEYSSQKFRNPFSR